MGQNAYEAATLTDLAVKKIYTILNKISPFMKRSVKKENDCRLI